MPCLTTQTQRCSASRTPEWVRPAVSMRQTTQLLIQALTAGHEIPTMETNVVNVVVDLDGQTTFRSNLEDSRHENTWIDSLVSAHEAEEIKLSYSLELEQLCTGFRLQPLRMSIFFFVFWWRHAGLFWRC